MDAVWRSLLRILALTRKELLAVLKDPRARASLLIPPILQSLIFGYAATYDLNHVPYAVLDQDRSAASAQLLADVQGNRAFQKIADLRRVSDIRGFIDSKKALIVIQVPQGFERGIQTGHGADVQVIADGRNSNTAGVANAYVGAIIEQFGLLRPIYSGTTNYGHFGKPGLPWESP